MLHNVCLIFTFGKPREGLNFCLLLEKAISYLYFSTLRDQQLQVCLHWDLASENTTKLFTTQMPPLTQLELAEQINPRNATIVFTMFPSEEEKRNASIWGRVSLEEQAGNTSKYLLYSKIILNSTQFQNSTMHYNHNDLYHLWPLNYSLLCSNLVKVIILLALASQRRSAC